MELNIRRILVPTDFGALSEHAVQYTIGLAATFGAAIRVLGVVDSLVSPRGRMDGTRDRGGGTAPPSVRRGTGEDHRDRRGRGKRRGACYWRDAQRRAVGANHSRGHRLGRGYQCAWRLTDSGGWRRWSSAEWRTTSSGMRPAQCWWCAMRRRCIRKTPAASRRTWPEDRRDSASRVRRHRLRIRLGTPRTSGTGTAIAP